MPKGAQKEKTQECKRKRRVFYGKNGHDDAAGTAGPPEGGLRRVGDLKERKLAGIKNI